MRLAYHRALERYRRKPRVLLVVLIAFLSLNAADLLLTIDALDSGASEANPLMAWLLGKDVFIAAVYKLSVGAAAALIIFALRGYRRVLEASLVLLSSFTALLGYHVFGAFVLAG